MTSKVKNEFSEAHFDMISCFFNFWSCPYGLAIWARPYGRVIWQSHMAEPYGRAIWHGHMAAAAAAAGGHCLRWRRETFSRNLTLKKLTLKYTKMH